MSLSFAQNGYFIEFIVIFIRDKIKILFRCVFLLSFLEHILSFVCFYVDMALVNSWYLIRKAFELVVLSRDNKEVHCLFGIV